MDTYNIPAYPKIFQMGDLHIKDILKDMVEKATIGEHK